MLDLQPVKSRLAAATPGPWASMETDAYHGQLSGVVDTDFSEVCRCSRAKYEHSANADLIAHAPTDLVALVAEVERLREENDLLRRRLHKEKKARERALGYDELTDDQKREILAINVAQLDWPD